MWRHWLRFCDNCLTGIARLLCASWNLPFPGLNKPDSSSTLSSCFNHFTLPQLLLLAIKLTGFRKTGWMSPSMDSILENKDSVWLGINMCSKLPSPVLLIFSCRMSYFQTWKYRTSEVSKKEVSTYFWIFFFFRSAWKKK